MKRIAIFSGTTEGRLLSEQLLKTGTAHIVCVASEYGGDLMPKDPLLSLHIGRMDAAEMTDFLSRQGFAGQGILVDATHPYAAEATANIRSAARALNCRYLRAVRQAGELPGERTALYGSMASCASALDETSGNILLTTGSKELSAYTAAVLAETRARTFVRVLPTAESISLCLSAGMDPRHIIAMHGPFGMDMNLAILRQYDISHLVTKESGEAGGFEDKVKAAKKAGAFLHVITRPLDEEGLSVEEVLRELLKDTAVKDAHTRYGKAENAEKAGTGSPTTKEPGLCVTLAGAGMGSPAGMTEEVKREIEEAELIFGAERLLRGIPGKRCYPMYRPAEIIPVLEGARAHRVLILFSGDSGFYSGARSMRDALLAWREDLVIRSLPGISSVSALAARAGVSYEDAAIFSLHGRREQRSMQQLLQQIRCHEKTFVLLSGDRDVRELGQALLSQGLPARILLGSRLYGDDESVRELSPAEAASLQEAGLLTALVLHRDFQRRPLLPFLKDEDLLRGPVPMTKAEIRHAAILRLRLREGDVVYDVGSGTGSVALEMAALDPSLTVYAFEREEEACGLIRENVRRLHADNVTVLQGEAPEVFAAAVPPDRVFIGGSGGRLTDILSALQAGGRRVRCVLTAVTLETMEEALRLVREKAVREPDMIQLQCTRIKEAGRYHLLQAGNPVMILSFTLGNEAL